MVLVARIFDEVATENDLTLSIPKTKLLVAGIGLTNDPIRTRWRCSGSG